MNLQRHLLRAMLWMLGLAAAAGVMTIFSSARVTGRVAGTALLAAAAIGLAMHPARALDDEKRRLGKTIALGGIVLAFVLALSAIWIDLILRAWDLEVRLAMSALLVVVTGFVTDVLLKLFGERAWRIAARISLVVVAVSFLILIVAVWWRDFDSRLAQTGCLFFASGMVGSVSLIGLGVTERLWRWLGVLASVGALGVGILGIWFIHSNDPSLFVVAMCAAVVVAHANAVLDIPLGSGGGWAKFAAVGSTAATGGGVAALSFLSLGFNQAGPETLLRLTGAAGIVASCSTLAVAVMYRLQRRPTVTSETVSGIAAVHLVCPHCAKKQALPIGDSACTGCGLLITVRVREPRCAQCDYPLLDLRGPNCPECGTAKNAASAGASG